MSGSEFLISAAVAALQTVHEIAGARRQESYSNQQAALARAQAAADAIEKRRATARDLGQARARLGAAGVTIEGSPIEVLADVAAEGELEAQKSIHRGEVAASEQAYRALEAQSRAGSALLGGAASVIKSAVGAGESFGLWDQSDAEPTPTTSRRGTR